MFYSKKIKQLESRIAELERNSIAHTWNYGQIDFQALARIVDGMSRKCKKPSAATDGKEIKDPLGI